jgi:hypothetical protein
VEVRTGEQDIVGYIFNLEELAMIKGALEIPAVRAYIQTLKTNFITAHILTPLLTIADKGPDFKLNMALDEAYTKGAIDMASEILTKVNLSGEN